MSEQGTGKGVAGRLPLVWESHASSGLVDVWLGLLLSIRDCPLGNPVPLRLTRELQRRDGGTPQSQALGNTQGFSTGPCGLLECNFCFLGRRESCSLDSWKCLEKPWRRMWDVLAASLCGYKSVSVELNWVLLLIFCG